MSESRDGVWQDVAAESDFQDTDRKLIDLGGEKQIGLFKVDGEYFAVSAWCSHQKASMMDGDIDEHELMCPLHGARFRLRDGKNVCLPAVRPIPSYPVRVTEGTISIQA